MKKEAGRRTVIRVMAVLFVGIMAGTVAASRREQRGRNGNGAVL